MVNDMNTDARVVFLSIFLVVILVMNWTISAALATEVSDSDENTVPSNQGESPQSEPTPQLTIVAETGYLELEQGFVGDKLGAEIESIAVDEAGEFQTININIPVENPGDINQVLVIGPAGNTVPQLKPAKISRDYSSNDVGVKLFLSKKKNWVFKVKLVDDSREDPPRQ